MRKHQFSTEQLNSIFNQQVFPESFSLIPKTNYYTQNRNGRMELNFYDHESARKYTFWRQGHIAGIHSTRPNYKREVSHHSGKIKGSIFESVRISTNDTLVPYRFMDAFQFDHNLKKQVYRNAKFSFSIEKLFDGNEFIKYGEILHANLEINGESVKRFLVPFPDGGAYVGSDWDQTSRPFYSPAAITKFSSLFSQRRRHPIQGYVKPHLGLDYELPTGAKIYAPADGRILRLGRNRAAGKFIVIKHRNGMETYYNHLSKINSQLGVGRWVNTGDNLGENGCTGFCTKPHLHFAIKKNGKFIDPIRLVKSYPFHNKNLVKTYLASQ